jgi:putative transposase
MGSIKRNWQDTVCILSFFGNTRSAKSNYLRFVEQAIARGRRPELVGGGLIRSLGGWAGVLALRGRGQKEVSDQTVLGDGEFVETVLSEIDDLGRVNLRLARQRMDLSSFAKRLCKLHEVSIGELRSGSRRHEIVEARRVFSWLAVKELGYPGAEVARYLGVTTSCVTRAASSGEEPERKGYISK